jgi:hypothetical protein
VSPHSQRRTNRYITNTAETATAEPSTATAAKGIAPNTLLSLPEEAPCAFPLYLLSQESAYPKWTNF